MSEKANTGDKISDGLGKVADIVDVVNQTGVKTGSASTWLRIGSAFASLGNAIARLIKRK